MKKNEALQKLAYCRTTASGSRNVELQALAQSSEAKRRVRELLEEAVSQEALAQAVAMLQKMPAILPQRNPVSAKLEPAPEDVGPLDSFYRDRSEANQIRREQKPRQFKRWAAYFERRGCISCGTKENPGSNGFCHRCRVRVWTRLKSIDAEQRDG